MPGISRVRGVDPGLHLVRITGGQSDGHGTRPRTRLRSSRCWWRPPSSPWLSPRSRSCSRSRRTPSPALSATTYAAVLAQQKMEQLRGLTWGIDALGLPVTDTTTDASAVPETGGGRGLSLRRRTRSAPISEGYCDFVDAFGRPLGGGTAPPAGTAYIRRWSIEALPADPTTPSSCRCWSRAPEEPRRRHIGDGGAARPTKRGSSASRPGRQGSRASSRRLLGTRSDHRRRPAAPRHGERLQPDAPVARSVRRAAWKSPTCSSGSGSPRTPFRGT